MIMLCGYRYMLVGNVVFSSGPVFDLFGATEVHIYALLHCNMDNTTQEKTNGLS